MTQAGKRGKHKRKGREADTDAPLVSAIVSTYNSERFMAGCLEDLLRQTIATRLEIIVIDSGSEQDEGAIVRDFQSRHSGIRYVRTERETIYRAWNRAIEMARGRYLSNANTDDRHRADAYEIMSKVLDAHPGAGAAYADCLVTTTEGETFERNSAQQSFTWPDFTLREILRHCFFGPQPMWRRSVHKTVGGFDDSLVSAGDYEFAIKVGWKCGAIHVRQALGLYTYRPDGAEHRAKDEHGNPETKRVQAHYRAAIPLEDIYPGLRSRKSDKTARASALLDLGNVALTASISNPEQAVESYDRALAVAPGMLAAEHNRALVAIASLGDQGALATMSRLAAVDGTAARNLSILKGVGGPGAQLSLMQADHPVVADALVGIGVDAPGPG